MTIKTLHLTNAWSSTSGGVATFYRALLAAGNRRGWPVRLVVPGERDYVEDVGAMGRIYHVDAAPSRLNSCYRTISPKSFLFGGTKIQQILAAERPDLVEINDKYTLNYLGPVLRVGLARDLDFRPVTIGLSCERMDRNFATYVHSGSLGRKFCEAYMRWLYFPFFDHHIAVSRHTMAELRTASRGHNIPRGTWMLPMGVDNEHFSPTYRSSEARQQLLKRTGGNDSSVLLLYAGRLVPEKNLGLLIDTLERLRHESVDYRLVVAGDGISRESFAAEAARRVPGRITFFGHLSDREALARVYANCDFFLHPNPSEPYGIAPLEAMASGLALIAPNSGGVKEYANQQNARLVAPNADAFADAITRLTADPDLRRSLTAAARATAQAYGWEGITDAYFDLYQRLCLVGTGRSRLAEAEPEFVSSAPGKARRNVLSGAAAVAQWIFSVVSTLAAVGRDRACQPAFAFSSQEEK
jgi:alpha-1,6-mannosyltransferase